MGWFVLILALGAVIALVGYQADKKAKAERMAARRMNLVARFGELHADRIIEQEIWVGETVEMLLESIGAPIDIDQKVLKTKRTEVYKYRRIAVNRFALKITVENGLVVGWDQKG